jgi:hypothetical protein
MQSTFCHNLQHFFLLHSDLPLGPIHPPNQCAQVLSPQVSGRDV